jgi:hypothetical protein
MKFTLVPVIFLLGFAAAAPTASEVHAAEVEKRGSCAPGQQCLDGICWLNTCTDIGCQLYPTKNTC